MEALSDLLVAYSSTLLVISHSMRMMSASNFDIATVRNSSIGLPRRPSRCDVSYGDA